MPIHGQVFDGAVGFVVVVALMGVSGDDRKGNDAADDMQGMGEDKKEDKAQQRVAGVGLEVVIHEPAKAGGLNEKKKTRQNQCEHKVFAEWALAFTLNVFESPVHGGAAGKNNECAKPQTPRQVK